MKIILEPTDFSEHFGAIENVERVLGYCYTIEISRQIDGTLTASFYDGRRGGTYSLVGPIDVTLVPLQRETRTEGSA